VDWGQRIEQQRREIDVQFLLGHSTPAMLPRHTAPNDAEEAAQAHALFSPADRLNGRLRDGGNGSRDNGTNVQVKVQVLPRYKNHPEGRFLYLHDGFGEQPGATSD
jgi:hypothetical protein